MNGHATFSWFSSGWLRDPTNPCWRIPEASTGSSMGLCLHGASLEFPGSLERATVDSLTSFTWVADLEVRLSLTLYPRYTGR